MEIESFIKDFAQQFDSTAFDDFKPETKFKELDEWSSLMALSIIAMVDEDYGVVLKGEDILNSNTIEDLYKVVVSRKQ